MLTTDPWVVRPSDEVVVGHPSGVRVVTPEVLMFYKSRICRGCAGCSAPRELRPHDEADFRALLPGLSSTSRIWLRDAMFSVEPGHSWLDLL